MTACKDCCLRVALFNQLGSSVNSASKRMSDILQTVTQRTVSNPGINQHS